MLSIRNQKFTSLCVLVVVLLVGPSEALDDLKSTELLQDPVLHLTSKLFARASKNEENLIMSPISIHSALNLVLLGADKSSETERQLLATLGYGQLNSDEVLKRHQQHANLIEQFKSITEQSLKVRKIDPKRVAYHLLDDLEKRVNQPILDMFNMVVANSSEAELRSDYVEKIGKYYNSSIELVDKTKPESISKLMDSLNAWGKEADLKEPLLSRAELDKEFAALLLSAIRVEASWSSEFWEWQDGEAFHQLGRASQPVSGLVIGTGGMWGKYLEFVPRDGKPEYPIFRARVRKSRQCKLYDELAHLNFRLVEVYLKGGLVFDILEPRTWSGSGGELTKLASQLMANNTLTRVMSLLNDCQEAQHKLTGFSLPKFTIDSKLDLKPTLEAMGLRKAFDEFDAEIHQMIRAGVYINDVKHQATFEARKEGIKAAAFTKVEIIRTFASMYAEKEEELRVDVRNPFIFLLRFKQIPLFVGQLVRV